MIRGCYMDIKDWQKKLGRLLQEYPGLGDLTGQVEINLNKGSVTKAYKIETENKEDGAIKIITRTELK